MVNIYKSFCELNERIKRYFKAVALDFKEWASKHRLVLSLFVILCILSTYSIYYLIMEIIRSNKGTIGIEGGYWEGEIKYGMAFGKGKHYNAIQRLIYEGEMKFNKYDGFGIEYYLNSTEQRVYYSGKWKMGMKYNGTFYSIAGNKLYSGECINESYDGKGILFDSKNQTVFEGTFRGGYKVNGIFYDKNGKVYYQGDCVGSIYHGYGASFSEDHKEYEGYYEYGVRSGRGISYYMNQQPFFIGTWTIDSMNYGLMFDGDGELTYQGIAYPSVLYIRTEKDLLSISFVTEEIVFASNIQLTTTEVVLSNLPKLHHLYFLKGSCQHVTSLILANLPSLESVHVSESSFSDPLLFDSQQVQSTVTEVLFTNCSSLRTIQLEPYAFYAFQKFDLISTTLYTCNMLIFLLYNLLLLELSPASLRITFILRLLSYYRV